jgi:hypothetical protein
MKYLFFFNGQLLLLCCVCCKIAIQDFVTRLHKKNKKNLRFHRRTITRRYFTESWKIITGVCHHHRRSRRRIITRRYFTESSKKITGVCHNHRRNITRRYFTESWKKITGVCHHHRRNFWRCTDVYYRRTHRRNTHNPKRTHVRHVSVVQTYRRIEKSGGIFEIFWRAYQLIADGITDGI